MHDPQLHSHGTILLPSRIIIPHNSIIILDFTFSSSRSLLAFGIFQWLHYANFDFGRYFVRDATLVSMYSLVFEILNMTTCPSHSGLPIP